MQRTFLHALIKLATKSGRFPQCLKLRSLAWESQPFSGGGFGDVYKGSVKSRPDVPLAIKVVKVYQSSRKDRLLKSFSSEAVVWSHLRHPNVLPFYGVFQQGDATLCLVSPYMGRGNVRSYLREGSKRVNRMLLALDAARGLEYLHNHNPTIVHADIKGVNILVSNSGRACLADFGFATAKDTNQAQAQSTMPSALTVAWSAPEILISFGKPGHQAHTTKSDMYSFGCVCYEIFCERDPFHGAGLPIVLGLIISGKRPERPERGAALHLNDELWRFMSRCWVENANERPSASDAVRLLERLAAKTGVGGAGEPQSTDEWDYSILEEILAETVHPFSMLLGVSMPPS
ncbi:kinase-like protein [Coniophora puteana RWD-64-598 SS2]|uniref:Kinase-like protein n=1 Tax=Coniophora puteana (strain RWD-64-598) TaxID=741705 RepID=A0A5M3MNW9_CONPW|nr:kinase-like protein [Coniophora puteana RWD-64-598 SS2]EIW80727.1 kinase-like protein [Coniophora puteana RWD-64-598 SS2]